MDDVKETMSKIRHRDFPILDEQRHLVGMMSRRNLLNMKKKQLILVDPNEKNAGGRRDRTGGHPGDH